MTIFSENPGRREASKRSTRLAIRLAAFDLFQREGIDHVTVEQIAVKADISPRTFFNYFATKEECVVFPYQLMAPALRLYLGAQPSDMRLMDAVEDALATMLSDMFSQVGVAAAIQSAVNLHQAVPALAMADASHKVYWEREVHTELVNRGSDQFFAQICAVSAIGICRASLMTWACSEGDTSIGTMVREGFQGLRSAFG
jgi:AcrR family transcriptional regulator